MNKDNTFYICATCLDKGAGYVSVTVTEVDGGNTIYFEDTDGNDYGVPIGKWRAMASNGFAIPESEAPAPEHDAWAVIDEIESLHGAVADSEVQSLLEAASESVFNAIHTYTEKN